MLVATRYEACCTFGTPALRPLTSMLIKFGIHRSESFAGPAGGGLWKPNAFQIFEAIPETASQIAPAPDFIPLTSILMKFLPASIALFPRLLNQPVMLVQTLCSGRAI